jgi:hypothetical protein
MRNCYLAMACMGAVPTTAMYKLVLQNVNALGFFKTKELSEMDFQPLPV